MCFISGMEISYIMRDFSLPVWKKVKIRTSAIKMSSSNTNANANANPNTPRADWFIVPGRSYTKDRASFTNYCELRGHINGVAVPGMGNAELDLLQAPGSPKSHKITLYRVLHIPSAICNGLALIDIIGVNTAPTVTAQGRIIDTNQGQLGYTDEWGGPQRVAVGGNPFRQPLRPQDLAAAQAGTEVKCSFLTSCSAPKIQAHGSSNSTISEKAAKNIFSEDLKTE
ncbi:hypothetical protein B0J14DRAFT_638991 [Halenospora varia]|nr:hypothetical protein B0J14DRAFT_638991 [Halenospora varia]